MKLMEQISHWMMRKRGTTLGLLAGSVTVGALPTTPQAGAQTQAQPRNVILILADDLGWTGINCEDGYDNDGKIVRGKYATSPNSLPEKTPEEGNFHTNYFTPNIAELRQESVRFTNAYACPWCTPTRMSLLTGKNIERCGPPGMRLSLAEMTIAEALDSGGVDYYCGWYGKHHTDDQPGATSTGHNPTTQGFDRFVDYETLGFTKALKSDGTVNLNESSSPQCSVEDGKVLADELTNAALDFLDDAKAGDRPFFLYLPYYAPHRPTPNLNAVFASAPDENSYAKVRDFFGLEAYLRFESDLYDSIEGEGGTRNVAEVDNGGSVSYPEGYVKHWIDDYVNRPDSGEKGRCLELDGTASISYTNYFGVTDSNPRTVSAWISTTNAGTVASWGTNSGTLDRWTVKISSNGYLDLTLDEQTTVTANTGSLSDGNWHHVSVTLNGATVNDVHLYVDGTEVTPFLQDSRTLLTGNGTVRIGCDIDGTSGFKGRMDDFRVYNRALDLNEIGLLAKQKLHENLHYAALIHRLDYNIGRIMDYVGDNGLADNTAIIFLSDNGGRVVVELSDAHSPDYNGPNQEDFSYSTHNWPLYSYKGETYEGGIRVPMLVSVPGENNDPNICDTPVTVADILPSVYELAYGEGSFDYKKHFVDGRSLLPLVEQPDGSTFERKYDDACEALAEDDFDGYIYNTPGTHKAIWQKTSNALYKLLAGSTDTELYNLDPSQGSLTEDPANDLWPANSDEGQLGDQLKKKLENWLNHLRPYVDNNGSRTYCDKVQTAIDWAEANGGTVVVPPATFYENLSISGDVILRSWDPHDPHIVAATIIDGQKRYGGSYSPTIQVRSEIAIMAILHGLTITGGEVGGVDGGGKNVIVENCRILKNLKTGSGAGIYNVHVDGALEDEELKAAIRNCTIEGNCVEGNGGGIAECDAPIANCVISGNAALGSGGGLYNCTGPITNCTLVDNASAVAGSGGGLHGCTGAISNCIIWGNAPIQYDASTTPESNCYVGAGTASPPEFVNSPRWTDITTAGGVCNGIVVSNALAYAYVALEYNNDGIARRVTAVDTGTGTVTFYPSLLLPSEANKVVHVWGKGVNPDKDYHLMSTSPCIDAESTGTPDGDYDIDGDERLLDGKGDGTVTVDIGADEYVRVRITGGHCYNTIQAAIDAAEPGDEIVVYPGRYNEQIVIIDEDITVRSVDPEDWAVVEGTVIDGTGIHNYSPGVVAGAGCTLRGFTVENWNPLPDCDLVMGGAIRCNGATISHCIIRDNDACAGEGLGAGIFIEGDAAISHCIFINNMAGADSALPGTRAYGGAIATWIVL